MRTAIVRWGESVQPEYPYATPGQFVRRRRAHGAEPHDDHFRSHVRSLAGQCNRPPPTRSALPRVAG